MVNEKSEIENYPHILKNILLFWNYKEGLDYFDKIMFSERESREGFSLEAFEELSFLKEILKEVLSIKVRTWNIHRDYIWDTRSKH